jgi:hypothetical protein
MLYLKTYIHFSYFAHFFVEWVMFQKKTSIKVKIHILFSITFFENHAVY